MIFKLIFRKKLKELKKKEQGIELERNRLKKVKYLLDERVGEEVKCVIETTNKGVEVLVAINSKENEIEVFDIDTMNTPPVKESGLWVKMWDKMRSKEVFLQDRNGKNKGFEEVAMMHLFNLIDKATKEKVSWKVKHIKDYNDKDKLITLYENMGFKIKHFSKAQ
ncbi:hypothetical protein KUL113_56260 [Tenacibaculum sp. KUL113]|nr:hypothetical protein KUL113_56260 [Tenacibaculum sp. KUL113]|eukprot:TRINITY_DN2580_c0_g1_i3.p1 TRINITY_DN2580_c0_g1~~TRINITY_DN2580_c0_g1_i3.p1  ORF type:complete len:165 (+),score=37.26 TRINITY_DN2580_c0_g1_i3:650-1144(+)